MRPSRPRAPARFLAALAGVAAVLGGCYTEIGNPGKENKVTATFSIDYAAPPPVPKRAAAAESVAITQFRFNVVEANYRTVEDVEGRIWKVPDSLGRSVDFTGKDIAAVLPSVAVPAAEWTILKLESRIPAHDTLAPDTLDFDAFADRGYLKGTYARGGRKVRFLCQLPHYGKVNLVYNQELLERWRHGDAYALEFVFFARRWAAGADLLAAETFRDRHGREVAVIDLEHNRPQYDLLSASFFRAFNSWKVWKEGDPLSSP
jgi:hypothetical protein